MTDPEYDTTIVQIIPATGWWAMYRYEDNRLEKDPLICWALVKVEHLHSDHRITYEIQGMVGHSEGFMDPASDTDEFVGYWSESQSWPPEESVR